MFTSKSIRLVCINNKLQWILLLYFLSRYHINQIPHNCSQSSECYCSAFYNYSRLVSDILFFNDYYRFLTQRIKHANKTFVYEYSYRTSQKHPTSCSDYLLRNNLVGHFAELEYTWGTPLLFDIVKFSNDLIPLINYTSHENNPIDRYTKEQIEFSQSMIEQWSNFIKYGQPNSTLFESHWIPIVNISNGLVMHFKINQSQMKKFQIPPNVQFWMNTCSTVNIFKNIDLNNQASICEISFTVIVFTGLFVVFILQESYMIN